MCSTKLYCLGAAILLVSICAAAQEIPQEFLACATIDDDPARLACFDREMTRQLLAAHEPAAAEEPPAAQDDTSTAVAAAAPEAAMADAAPETAVADAAPEPTASETPVAAATTTIAATTSAAVSTDEEFGMTEKLADERAATTETPEREAPQQPDQITSTVTDIKRQPHGEHVVALDNGQVWAEENASRYFPVEVGDTVIIKKRWLSGYRLVTESGKGFAVERLR